MAIHISILAWEIPWTEKPDRLHGVAKELDITEMSSRFWDLAETENQASLSTKVQPGQHKDLYCGNIVVVFQIYCSKTLNLSFPLNKFSSV